jgi:proton glutamate symport protein
MIPTNIVAAASAGQMLGLIFFSLLYGFFMTRIPNPTARPSTTSGTACSRS